ncbi:MAG: hypothetical protein II942_01760 [Alphaproteobacteria bacterium]|nr:hypothetical protein [Alphaproteobacteria bacterium]
MLDRAYRYINDEDIFQLRGSLLDKATFQKMLRMIVKTKTGRDLICRIGDVCERREVPVVLSMMKPKKDALGYCDPSLVVKIGNPNQSDFSKAQTDRAIFQQTLTLTHELGHALQFLKREDRINASLPLKERFYAQVWMEAEADLWSRDVESELVPLYPGLTRNISLMKKQFKSRIDFVRSFFVKGRNYNLMTSAVEVLVSDLMQADEIVEPNDDSDRYFNRLMNQRFQRMRLDITYADMPLEKCFWVNRLSGGPLQIHNSRDYAVVDTDGDLLILCDQKQRPVQIKAFGDDFYGVLIDAAEKLPIPNTHKSELVIEDYLGAKPFRIGIQQVSALARRLDRFGGRAP